MEHFLTKDQLSLYCESSVPANPKAAILFIHGLGEHIARYRQTFEDFSGQGYGCFGFDQRGFGRSPGKRGHVEAFSDYLDDLDAFIEYVSNRTQGLPLFLFGHSLGSIIVLSYAITYAKAIDGLLIFSNPLCLRGTLGRLFSPILGELSALFPCFSVSNRIDPKALTNDPAILQIYQNDPLVVSTVTLNWLHEFTRSCRRVKENSKLISLPAYIAHGTCDRIADVAGAEFLFRNIAAEDKFLSLYRGFKHELLNHRELDRRNVLEDVFQWLELRSRPA